MLALLRRVDPVRLHRLIGPDTIRKLDGLVSPATLATADASADKFARYLLALFGTELLAERRVRRLVFQLLDSETLKELSLKHAQAQFERPADNALALSMAPWRAGSALVYEVARALSIPRDYLPVSGGREPTVQPVDPVFRLHPLHAYQGELRDLVHAQLRNNAGAMLIQMPTGAGKTRTTLQTITEHVERSQLFVRNKCVLWLAHTEELCEQAIETFTRVWRAVAQHSTQVVRCWGVYSPDRLEFPRSFVVATYQRLAAMRDSKDDIYADLVAATELVVADEAHKVLAPTFKTVVEDLRRSGAALVGLTATPGRSAGAVAENRALADLFDRNLVSPDLGPNPIQRLRELGVLSELAYRPIHSNIDVELSERDRRAIDETADLSDTILKRLAAHRDRNKQIVEVVKEELDAGNPCLVFSCGVQHSQILAAALSIDGYPAAHIDGTMRKAFRRSIVDGFRAGEFDVLINFGVLSTGFDAPRIRTVVVTRPTASVVLYSQMIGRGLRGPRMGGAEKCNLVDIRDNFRSFGTIDNVYACFSDYWTSAA